MNNRLIRVPVAQLLDPGPTASMKVVWIAQSLNPSAKPAELKVQTGLSLNTVLKGLSYTAARNNESEGPMIKGPAVKGPAVKGPRIKGPMINVPRALLADRTVGPQAKVLYGLLQCTPNYRELGGLFTYASLHSLTQRGRNTLKRAILELVGAGWVQITQANRLSPIHFTLGSPELKRSQSEAADALRRLKRAKLEGEALMQEYLSLLIASDQFTDNARPGFLVNPQTRERLELDRFYPPHVAFEFHGSQHSHATARFTQAVVDAQHLRDLIKAGICLYQGIHLVIIRSEDLSVQGMIKKIGQSMPRRNLAGHEPLIDLLEDRSLRYDMSSNAARKVRNLTDANGLRHYLGEPIDLDRTGLGDDSSYFSSR